MVGRAASQIYERHGRSPFATRARDFTHHLARTLTRQAALRVVPRLRAGQASNDLPLSRETCIAALSLRSSWLASCFTTLNRCAMIRHVSSLKQFIRESPEVRRRFAELLPKPEFASKPLLVPPSRKYSPQEASLIGTAFDYLLRFFVQRLNLPIAKPRRWVAEAAVNDLEEAASWNASPYHDEHVRNVAQARRIVGDARLHLAGYINSGIMSDAFIYAVLNLSTLDPIARAGSGDEMIGVVNAADTQDLQRLLQTVNEPNFRAKSLCLLNPVFNESPDFAIGADADLVVDDVIIDIKTTQPCRLNRSDLDQLIGYFLLNELVGFAGVTPKPRVTKVGIYFSRHAYLHVIPIRTLIADHALAELLPWFRDRLVDDCPQDLDWKPAVATL